MDTILNLFIIGSFRISNFVIKVSDNKLKSTNRITLSFLIRFLMLIDYLIDIVLFFSYSGLIFIGLKQSVVLFFSFIALFV